MFLFRRKMRVFVSFLMAVLCSGPLFAQDARNYLELQELLNEVKVGLIQANRGAPHSAAPIKIKSVELTLVGVTRSKAGLKNIPILFFTAGTKVNRDNTHTLNVSLKPAARPLQMKGSAVASALADAIAAVYIAREAEPDFLLTSGYFEIKCVITRGASGGLVLTPVEAEGSYEKELTQTIKINF